MSRPPAPDYAPAQSVRTDDKGDRSFSPELVMGGAVAAGIVAAALLPTSRLERDLAKPIGVRIIAKGKDVLRAAKSAVTAELKSVPLSAEAASAQVTRVVDRVVEEAIVV